MRHVAVVGAGIAGTAAAIAASRRGAKVSLVRGRPGATVLAPGALDALPWEDGAADVPAPLDAEARAVLGLLEAYTLPEGGLVLAASTGLVRRAAGADRALFDLSSLSSSSGTLLVPSVDHPSWDARAMARGWGEASWAGDRGLSFAVEPAALLRFVDERSMSHSELAARHDDAARVAWLGDRLADTLAQTRVRPAGILLPPWLGVDRSVAQELTSRLGLPCGEVMPLDLGPSGLRFERARDRALSSLGVEVIDGLVASAQPDASQAWTVLLESDAALSVDAVVLAVGGLVGGGLEYTPGGSQLAAAFPPSARPLARLTVRCPATLAAFGLRLDVPGSLSGPSAETHAWPFAADPLLDHIGVEITQEGRVVGAPAGLFAAGDVVADRHRTWLEALACGARAGAAAARGASPPPSPAP